ncbi:hypothetical protein G6F56_004636 [Rhizopus delemar]|nr:hypothetical protein G6F56_004636 [Rhizopus delemar]
MPATAAQQKSEIQSKKMTITVSPSEVETNKAKEILTKLSGASDADRESIAEELAAFVKTNGVLSLKHAGIVDAIVKDFGNKKSNGARASAVAAFAALSNNSVEGQAEPFIISLLTYLLELQADKQASIKNAAAEAAKNFIVKMNANACSLTVPYILEGLGNSCKWQTKIYSCCL